jgi:hypothetical protein
MTDASAGEMPAEPAPPILPAPGVAAEIDAAPPQAASVDGLAPAPDEPVAPSAEAETEAVESFDPRISIPESLGPVRRAVLEGLLDGEGPMSVSELHALMPVGTPRGTAEAAILREYRSGRITRTSPGHYVLAPVQPSKPAKPVSPPAPSPEEEQVWGDALERWFADPDSWDREVLGPRPNEPGRRIPADIVTRGVDRSRKRQERRREAEAAAAKRGAADAELRDRLIAATGGNVVRGPGIEDVTPIKLALELVPLDRVLSSIRSKTHKKLFPGNEPAKSWSERRLLKEIAENYCRTDIVPRLVDAWSKAGKSPAPTVPSSPPAGDTPDDIDNLRSHHDSEHAPPGPHSLPNPSMTGKAVERPAPSDACSAGKPTSGATGAA